MKTTSHLGGRKAHTAKRRRVRYETSTRVLRVRGVRRMIRTFLHAWGPSSSAQILRHPGHSRPGAPAYERILNANGPGAVAPGPFSDWIA
jgi:hypothetical protein